MIAALACMGIDAALGGRNDILVGDKKISGNAQYSSNGRILHHGTLLFDADGSVMERVLRVDKEKLTSHGVSSHKSRVANIKSILQSDISVEDFISTLEKHIKAYLDPDKLTLPNSSVINELAARNASEEWILSNKKSNGKAPLTQSLYHACVNKM